MGKMYESWFMVYTSPIKAKFYAVPPWVRCTKVCSWYIHPQSKPTFQKLLNNFGFPYAWNDPFSANPKSFHYFLEERVIDVFKQSGTIESLLESYPH